MVEPIDKLAAQVTVRLRKLRLRQPSRAIVRQLLRLAYIASLKTEEGRAVRSTLVYADPASPDLHPPQLRRADYPAFTRLGHPVPLDTESVIKLARAVDKWSGAIAVWGRSSTQLKAWGVLDQVVQENLRTTREAQGGFGFLGLLVVTIEGTGEVSVYHGNILLGALRLNRVVTKDVDALRSAWVMERVLPCLRPAARAIAACVKPDVSYESVVGQLFEQWVTTVSRLCIGLRRFGTGGCFVLSPKPLSSVLHIGHQLKYTRLRDSLALHVLDETYSGLATRKRSDAMRSSSVIDARIVLDEWLADADEGDRADELRSAIKLVTSLAAVDGFVLLTPDLMMCGFGVKTSAQTTVGTIYDGQDFSKRGTKARRMNLSRFGTRHGSAARYCRSDSAAVAVVISQDGQVRLIGSAGRSMTLWDDVKLLGYSEFTPDAVRRQRGRMTSRSYAGRQRLGYTTVPKTYKALLAKVKP